MRESGILLAISSLPSEYGIGCFSREAYEFADRLSEAGQSYWQILPLGPVGYGDSPYQSFSTFAGNPYYISPEKLVEKGWINYRIFPMASNIQLVFYRRNAADSDVLVKILLNENEATLPPSVKPVSAPYYRWSDVRQFFMSRIGE